MAESRNRVGGAYALTVLTPILPGHEQEVQTLIDELPRESESPLARLEGLHFSRIHIFDELVYQGAPQKREKLGSRYLVFTSSFDGDLDPYLDEICEKIPEAADSWWRHCVGYPGTADPAAFRRYIRHNKIDTSLFASAHPNATVGQIRDSLALRERIVAFATEAQGLDAAELQGRFTREFAAEAG